MSDIYVKPTVAEARRMVTAFASIPASKMMKLRERTTKMIILDYASHLINEKSMSLTEVCAKVEEVANSAIEKGLCSSNVMTTVVRFVNKKFQKPNPALKLHCAVTLEALEELGGEGNTDTGVLPEEIQQAAECGSDCFDSRPSLESLNGPLNDATTRLYKYVGGALSTEVMQSLSDTLSPDYMRTR